MKTFFFGLTALIALGTNAFAGGYQLGAIDRIEILENNDVRLTYSLKCKELDFETFTAASDDSGDMELRVGVVYACKKGPLKQFSSVVTPSWPEYKLLEAGVTGGGSLVPMKVR